MKTREELAGEDERYKIGALERTIAQGMYQGYLRGFDAGFARACELLRSEEFHLWFSEPADQKSCADWLEKQTPDESLIK